jgi:hypothetical protein
MSQRTSGFCVAVVSLALFLSSGAIQAATFTVVNNCSYTVYPGIYPPVFQNGGWAMAPGARVSFSQSAFTGRLWGRIGCNSASPAQCATGSCGGTGLQCAGTTGQAGTSLFEINLNAAGTDWYNVSYVDGIDNPIGVTVSNGACVSPTCSNAVKTSCPADLVSGSYCLSPCTRYNTDQYCCRGAFGTPQTCVVSQWALSARAYVDNIHTFCPREYAYAYDEGSGALQTCPTGANYTVTFCPAGGATPPPPPPPAIDPSRWYNVINQGNGKCVDDTGFGTTNGTRVQQWDCNPSGQFNQEWQFTPTSDGYYRVMVRTASWLGWDVTGGPGATGIGIKIQLWGVGNPAGTNQQWRPESMGNGFWRFRARHSNMCLDVPGQNPVNGLQLQQWDCNGTVAQSFRLVAQP